MTADAPPGGTADAPPGGTAAIRVAVAGAAGRMGATTCEAVIGAPDMELVARADPALGVTLAQALDQDPDVLVDFTVPTSVVQNARQALAAGVHVVIGTTGFDLEQLRTLRGANIFTAPNFAIGAVLMMQFAVQAATHMAKAEIIELHHDGKLDKPSGTAARTAMLMREAVQAQLEAGQAQVQAGQAQVQAGQAQVEAGQARPAQGEAGQAQGEARRREGAVHYEVPIHSVRLPGLVAHQEVILGDLGQTLTIRHDSVDRQSFMPGVLLAVRRVATLTESPVVGLEHLLGLQSANRS